MDDEELLRALKRIAQQDPGSDPRWRKLAEEALPEDAQGAPGGAAERPREDRQGRQVRTPLDDETRARLSDQLIAQLREPRGDAPAPPSPPRPMVDRKSGIRFRGPHEWDCEAEEPGDAAEAPQLGADADSLSGTSAPSTPSTTDAPVCRAIGGESVPPGASNEASEPPCGALPSAAPGPSAALTLDGADLAVRLPRERPPCPELIIERRTARRDRARTLMSAAGWVVAGALVSLLALRPAPFAPGAAPLPEYTIATTLGDGPQQGDRDPGAPRHVGRGARLTIALAPGARVPAPVDVKAFLVQGGQARPWPVAIEHDGIGGARVSGTREALFKDVAAGTWEVVFVIGEPGSLSSHAEALPDERAVHLAGGQLLRQRLFLD